MEGLERTVFNFCPFCGNKLFSGQGPIRFCPACGQKLSADENDKPQTKEFEQVQTAQPQYDKVETIEDVIACYEQFIKDKRREDWPEEKIQKEAAELVATLKRKITVKLDKFSQPAKVHSTYQAAVEYNYYSLILKDCPIKENLARHLEAIMVRGYFAIRMAIDKVPSVIIYKSNMDNVIQMIRAFRQERAGIAVIGGDFSTNVDVDRLFAKFFALLPESETAIRAVPANMWLGDNIIGVASAVHSQCGKGVTVTSNQAVYFLYPISGGKAFAWRVIPYYRVKQVKVSEGKLTGTLEVHYRDIEDTETFTLDAEELSQVNKAIQAAMKEERYHTFIKRICLTCRQSVIEEVETAYEGEYCPHCQQKLVRKMVKSKE